MSNENVKVLIVEDDPDFAESLMIALGVRECHVDIARTGEEAIRKYRWCRESDRNPEFLSFGQDCHDDRVQ
jgi:ActR/RegA family two-component response regulator